MLEVFSATADEIDTSFVPAPQRQRFRNIIDQNLPTFVAFVSQLIATFASSSVSLTRAALRCLTLWVKFEIKIRYLSSYIPTLDL